MKADFKICGAHVLHVLLASYTNDNGVVVWFSVVTVVVQRAFCVASCCRPGKVHLVMKSCIFPQTHAT